MKIYSKEQEKALHLLHKLNIIAKKHNEFIDKEIKFEKTKAYKTNEAINKARFAKLNKSYDYKESMAYNEYYNFMHKHLKITNEFLKYKNKFIDEKFVNDMFKAKAKEDKKLGEVRSGKN